MACNPEGNGIYFGANSFRMFFMKVVFSMTLVSLIATVAQAQFTYTQNSDNTITITGYTGSGGNVVIPDTINGFPVKVIAGAAFDNQFSITNVTLPDTLTNIGSDAFAYCGTLKSIAIPDTVSVIGLAAFESCQELTSISVGTGNPSFSSVGGVLLNKNKTVLVQYPGGISGSYSIPSTVGSIGQNAFWGCWAMSSVTIPSAATNIGPSAFEDCTGLTAINVDAANTTFSSTNGVLFDKSQRKLIQFPGGKTGAYVVPPGVTSISQAFTYCRVASVVMSSSVTNLDMGVFSSCFNLTNVTISPGITHIRAQDFWYCNRLTRVVIPASVTNMDGDAFQGCYALTNVYFQGNAPTLDAYYPIPFDGDTNATLYYLPGTSNWPVTFSGQPTVLWNPVAQAAGTSTSPFAFTISGTPDIPIAIESCTDFSNPTWSRLQTCTLTNGVLSFSDSSSGDFSAQFYRIAGP